MKLFSSDKGEKRAKKRSFEKKMLSPKKAPRVKRRATGGKPTKGSGLYSLLLFLWLLLFATALYTLFFSPSLALSTISVSGGNTEASDQVKVFLEERLRGKYFHLLPKGNFFVIRKDSLERQLLERFPLLRSIEIRQTFPDKLLAEAQFRPKAVLWCSGGPCYLLSEDGMTRESGPVFAFEGNQKDALFIVDQSGQPVRLGQRLFDFDLVSFTAELAPRFESRIGMPIQNEYSAPSRFADTLRIRTEEGFEIYVNTRIPLDDSLDTLALLLEKEINEEQRKKLRYIDLRTENRIYYAFQEGEEKEGQAEEKGSEDDAQRKEKDEKEKKKP